MKFDPGTQIIELTTRNLNALRDKLDDPQSAPTLGSPCGLVRVHAVEDGGRASTDTREGMVVLSRSELVKLLAGESVVVGDVLVVPVPDAAHYTARPAGDVLMPSTGELRPGVLAMSLRHICEVCGVDAVLTPGEAYRLGWDYPPKMGRFGVISPRTCPDCPDNKTVWWALMVDTFTADMLSPEQRGTIDRIRGEPRSIMVKEQ